MPSRHARDTTQQQPSSNGNSISHRSGSVGSLGARTSGSRVAGATGSSRSGRRSSASPTGERPQQQQPQQAPALAALHSVLVSRHPAIDTDTDSDAAHPDSSPRIHGLQSPHPPPAVAHLLLSAPLGHCSSSSTCVVDSAEQADPSRSLLRAAPPVTPHPESYEGTDSPSPPAPRPSGFRAWLRRLCCSRPCCSCCCGATETERQMCGIICCFGCLTCMGCRDKVCQRLVFFPPQPFYAVEERHGSQTMWLVEDGRRIEPYTSANMRVAFVHTRRQSSIATLWLRYPGATTTILFSHGNATDIGCCRDHLIDFARQLRVNVLAYDYTGYGLSAGPRPTVAHTLADVEAAYDYLLRTYPNESARVIAYGQSIGSGPTTHLARCRRLNGVVIHSGIMSALRVIQPAQPSTRWFDIFPNVDLMAAVPACVFVIHGTGDKEIPVEHGEGLAAAAPNSFPPWFVEGAGHNNVEVDFREAYFAQLDQFVRFIEQSTPHVEETDDPTAKPQQQQQQQQQQARGGAAAGQGDKKGASSGRASIEMQTYNRKGLGPVSSSSHSGGGGGSGGSASSPRPLQSPKLPPNHQPTAHRESFDQI